MKPNIIEGEQWEMKFYGDRDWAGDKTSSKSITEWEIFLAGCLVSWGSHGQKMVTLSSSEAEYVAVSELCKEILYLKTILESLGENVKLPITVYFDNVGEIVLAKNNESKRTKYIETRVHFVRDHVINGTVIIKFVRSENNKADPFTKNVNESTHMQKFTD